MINSTREWDWMDDYRDTTEKDAKDSLCGNCEAFDIFLIFLVWG